MAEQAQGNAGPWCRPVLTRSEHQARLVLDEIFERSGFVVLPNQKLSQIIYRRPPDITNEQWSYATRAQFDFVVCNATTYMPDFAVELDDPTHRKPEAQRRDRMKDALCEAAGLELLRIESSALYPGPHGRRILEYLVDARSFMQAVWEQQEAGLLPQDEPFDYRNAIGRLPNGRLGFINDLGTLARLAAIDAHDKKLVASPIIQGLSLYWKDGWAEGWGWLHLKDDLYFFERVQVREYRFYCGIGAGDLAQDLAAAAVGEKLRLLGSDEPILSRWSEIKRAFERVKERRVELDDHFLIDHTSFQ